MFEKWIDVLSGEDLNLTADEIADICWLALIQHRFGVEQPQKAAASPASLASQLPTTLGSSSTISTDLPDLTKSELPRGSSRTAGGLFAKEASSEPRPDSKPLRVPTAPALRDSLSLAKAMRPLIQQRPIGKGPQLDEPATVQKIAEERVWWPVTKPLTENWLELALVVDESISMLIWRRTIQELNRFFKHYGVFRDVRLWGLIARDASSDNPISSSKGKRSSDGTVNNPKASSHPEICIRAAPFSHVHSQALRRPDCLLDPAGRRLILIISDCVDAIWQKPQLLSTLKLWSKNGPMAILQMMPEWLWPRTNLRQTTLVNFQGKAAGSANHALEVVLANAAYYRKSKAEKQADIKVPIITLESDRVHIWTQMLTAQGPHQAPGVIFNPRAREMMVLAQRRRQQVASGSSTATVKAQTFRGAASPIARRLASLLAASPAITLPIVRVVQETLLPQSEQVHVAEVFLGGILQPRVTPAPDTNPDDVEYQFVDSDVRSVLLAEAPVPDTTAVLTQYIEENFKTSLHDFILELRRFMHTAGANQDKLKPIATIAAEVLQYRGAEYADFVREVRECYPPSTLGDETDESQSFAVPDLEPFNFLDAQLLDGREAVTFPPFLQAEEFTIITVQSQPGTDLTPELEPFEFTLATLTRNKTQWDIQRQQRWAYRFIGKCQN